MADIHPKPTTHGRDSIPALRELEPGRSRPHFSVIP